MGNKPQYKPLYIQIYEILHKRIIDSVYKVEQEIPSEKNLAEEFEVSISTIRQAVGLLVNDGLLDRKQGKGTFVTNNPIKVRFLGWIAEIQEGEEIMEKILNIFERKNPNIKIEYIKTEHANLKQKYLQMVQQGEAPDVVQIVSHWTSKLASMGLLEQLNDLLPASNLEGRFQTKDLKGGMYNNKLYSVAWGLGPIALIYNRKLLEKCDINLPADLTPDSFFNICRQIDNQLANQEIYVFGFCRTAHLMLFTYNFLLAFNADFIDNENIVIDSSEAIEAFKWLKELINKVNVIWKDDIWELRHLFANNKLVFLEDGPWIRGIMKDFSDHHDDFDEYYGVVRNPSSARSKYSSWNYNHGLAISSMSDKKESAAKFIDALSSDPDICNLYFHQFGLLPPQKEMLKNHSFSEHIYYKPFIQQLKKTRPLNAENPLFEKAQQFIVDAAINILEKDVDIKEELEEKSYYLQMLYSD